MPEFPRRHFLELCGAALSASIAGCSQSDRSPATTAFGVSDPDTPASTPTAAQSATDPPTDTTAQTTTPPPENTAVETWNMGQLSGQVDILMLPESGPTDDPSGPLYAATNAGEVARTDPRTGRHEWMATVRGEAVRERVLAPVGETIYAISETFTDDRLANHVEALNPATGKTRWVFEDRAFLRVLGLVEDLVVLAGEYILDHPEEIGPNEAIRGDGRLYGLDRATGEQRWTVAVPELRGADVASHGIYALERQDYSSTGHPDRLLLSLLAFNPDGTERWTVETGTINPIDPLAADDLLLAGAGTSDDIEQGAVGRYDPADGSLLWTAGDWDRGPENLAVQGDTIQAGGRPEGLLVLDHDGRERFRVRGFIVPEVPDTPETLYNDGGSRISAVDRDAGEIRWRYQPENYKYTHIRAVLANYVAVDRGIGNDREVVLIGETSGQVIGTFETPGYYFGTVGAGHRLFAGVGSDIIAYDVLNDRS